MGRDKSTLLLMQEPWEVKALEIKCDKDLAVVIVLGEEFGEECLEGGCEAAEVGRTRCDCTRRVGTGVDTELSV